MREKTVHWNGGLHPEAVTILKRGGGLVVSPTKVGYIILATDTAGLERKFDAKERSRNKPGVVLCGSQEQLKMLAQMNQETERLYRSHDTADVLLGCILPWRDDALKYIPQDGAEALMTDSRGTSCFVLRFGAPGEYLARALWENHGMLTFASSANPSGKGNRGLVSGIGVRIESAADLIIEGDDYVRSIQPDKTTENRHEQGVMVSMVDAEGKLVPPQEGRRGISPCPVVIRRGLDVHRVMAFMSEIYPSWDYRHGNYY
ncbi:L-threonylcarbamoyladenylate synthase [Symbiopectobacterium purcellii]|uniref:Sua5/YciO/YrdC/YwlC family protein n=1 Tax=Symbiopectobacterium purcellii TaxID=2871826 RepID=A0ABX9AKX9_9ENTR|nr:Sua5/YciO/YrdC/YwlC family protein [Symbiopectobacterium purcellii]QZN95418.1 Sua5/YciO/YrdC/YwlC family protein [Symbiopectobacterium purcellii]